MTVEQKFYLLILDEVRSQPTLLDELPFDLEQHAERFAGCPLDVALERLTERQPCTRSSLGFDSVKQLKPQPPRNCTPIPALRDRLPEDVQQDYTVLCRNALLNLVWLDLGGAEEKINLAKYLNDAWAFAHFLYGMLRGVDGEVGKAHFELYLAINRENLICAQQRIERALSLVR